MTITAVILAAGQGTRMRSILPKVLHPLGGLPLIEYSLRLAEALTSETPVVVIGHGADLVRSYVGSRARFVVQQPQLGTAHAVQTAEPLIGGQDGLVLVISADMPLFSLDTLRKLIAAQQSNAGGPLTMTTMLLDDSHGFGRIVRAADGSVAAIVEEAQATPEQLAIRELNVGAYCFDSRWLWDALKSVPLSPKGEYYLTDTVAIAVAAGLKVQALRIEDHHEAIGINTRVHLAEAEAILRRRINTGWLLSGVTMLNPDAVYIEPDVQIGRDTTIYPNTYLRGQTVVGDGCVLGPDLVVDSSRLGPGCRADHAVIQDVVIPPGGQVGPYRHLSMDEVNTSEKI